MPVILKGAQGTAAHNTAYPIVINAIASLGFVNPRANNALRGSDGDTIISAKRPDWQGFGGNNSPVNLWEMKQGFKGIISANKDLDGYIALSGGSAQKGPELGVLGDKVKVKSLSNIYIDILSPMPGVVSYIAYMGIDKVPEPQPIAVKSTATQDALSFALVTGLAGLALTLGGGGGSTKPYHELEPAIR